MSSFKLTIMSNTAIRKAAEAFEAALSWEVEGGSKMFTWTDLSSLLWVELISLEKQQIVDAYNQGYRDGELEAANPNSNDLDISLFSNAETYFNEKYGQP